MIAPHALWSAALVVLACALVGGRAGGAGGAGVHGASGSSKRRVLTASAVASLALLLAVVVGATELARALSVTPPTVRLAAGVAVAINAVAVIGARSTTRRLDGIELAATTERAAPTARAQQWPGALAAGVVALQWAVAGPVRVEVVAALWAATLDQGRAVGALSALAGVGAGVGLTVARGAKGSAIARRGLATAALCVAVIVGVHGVLGL